MTGLIHTERQLRRVTNAHFPLPLRPPPLMEGVLPLVRNRVGAHPGELIWGTWLVVTREGRRAVGALGFGGPPDPEGDLLLGYATYPESDRKGYATEATRGLVEWALQQPGVRRVCCSIPADNIGARRVAEKVGMRIVGTVWEEDLDDALLYAVER
jgi:RimJ/RimL family protein N-acetyltransferase